MPHHAPSTQRFQMPYSNQPTRGRHDDTLQLQHRCGEAKEGRPVGRLFFDELKGTGAPALCHRWVGWGTKAPLWVQGVRPGVGGVGGVEEGDVVLGARVQEDLKPMQQGRGGFGGMRRRRYELSRAERATGWQHPTQDICRPEPWSPQRHVGSPVLDWQLHP